MPKKKTTNTAKRKEFVKPIESGGGNYKELPWPELKRRAKRAAEGIGFDVERILFGVPLEEKIADVVNREIEATEELGGTMRSSQTFLRTIRGIVAEELAMRFVGDCYETPQGCLDLALTILYLFPKLWKALDKPLALNEQKALDLDELLSDRRDVEFWA
jgi:hypothetical protein